MKKRRKRAAAGTKKAKKVQNAKRNKRTVDTSKWTVTTRYYGNGAVISSLPCRMSGITETCGWTFHEYRDYYEWIDIFESQRSAERFIRELETDYKEAFSLCA